MQASNTQSQSFSPIHLCEKITFSNGTVSRPLFDEVLEGISCLYVVKNFVSEEQCRQIAGNLKQLDFSEYGHEEVGQFGIKDIKYYGVDRCGVPFNSTYGRCDDSEEKRCYYQNIERNFERIRSICPNQETPIDRLKNTLKESSDARVSAASFEGKEMFYGIVRRMVPEFSHLSEAEPHFDFLPSQYSHLKNQIAANVYIETPEHGGDLEIYSKSIPSDTYKPPKEWRSRLFEEGYFPIRYQPQRGDLLIFGTRQPHSIYRFHRGTRVNFQTFIGQESDGGLVFWN